MQFVPTTTAIVVMVVMVMRRRGGRPPPMRARARCTPLNVEHYINLEVVVLVRPLLVVIVYIIIH